MAGMNFTNLIVAVPLLTTFILLVINFIHSPHKPKILNAKFQIITITSYVLIITLAIYYKNIPDVIINIYSWIKLLLINHPTIIVIAYIPFMFLAWCIYNDNEQNSEKSTNQHKNIELQKIIKGKIKQLQDENKFKNILINGHWGSGKTYFAKNTLSKTIDSSIYISCTDYPDMFELVNALVYRSNNVIMRQLIRFSLGKLLSVITKTELRQYVGNNKIIILDEFERLVDYNKIDYMHIVSLIQYLNDVKNCICILIANEDHLTYANQFNNVREKLISHFYHYKLEFDNVLALIEKKEQNGLDKLPKLKSAEEQIIKYSLITKSNSNKDEFSDIYLELKRRYNLDNNIRMLEHTYKKINEIYQYFEKNTKFDDFKSKNTEIKITKDKYFALLFSNVLDLIIPLYYLYLKNPYNLKAVETLAIIYTNHKPESNLKDQPANINNRHNEILKYYLDKDSIQSLALNYYDEDNISYKNKENELNDKSYDLNYIITDQNFENINMKSITDFLGIEEIVITLLPIGKYGKTLRENIINYIRLFKENFCESEDQELIINYFKQINVLEQRFLRVVNNDTNASWDDSIVTDYIAYCKYIDTTWPRDNPNNIRPVSYNKIAYINALIIQYLSEKSDTNYKNIIDAFKLFYSKDKKTELTPIIYELTAQQAVKKERLQNYINLILQIVMRLLKSNKKEEDYLNLLNFMYQSYNEIIKYLNHSDIKLCNKNMTKLLEINIKDKNYCDSFFNLLSSFNLEAIKFKPDEIIIENYIKQISELITTLSQYYNSIILLNQLNTTYSPIRSSLNENTIKLCNQNMINLIELDHTNEKSFLNTLFMHLTNFNLDSATDNFPNESLDHLLTKIQKTYDTNERKQSLIDMFSNNQNNLCKKVMKKLQEELNNNKNNETSETEGKE